MKKTDFIKNDKLESQFNSSEQNIFNMKSLSFLEADFIYSVNRRRDIRNFLEQEEF
jgi:hypothetical protein